MKNNFARIGLAKLCGWFGVTRQAYYQNNWEGVSTTLEEELVIQQVKSIRSNHKRMGTRKLYEMLHPFMQDHAIKMGRDALFNVLSANHMLVRKRKRRIKTTNSYHWLRKYPNLIRDFVPTGINQLWVSDITYWKLGDHPTYISFITDVYSHKIVGYQLADTMEAIESVKALQMALSAMGAESHLNLIHHSDRGIQYCSQAYIKLLKESRIQISMTENGDPLENAVAERVNGIIKDEYLDNYQVTAISEAKELLASVVNLYNNERPHMSISNFTPNQIHQTTNNIKTERLWKNYYKKQPIIVNQEQD
jgi:transposase InsO family protein